MIVVAVVWCQPVKLPPEEHPKPSKVVSGQMVYMEPYFGPLCRILMTNGQWPSLVKNCTACFLKKKTQSHQILRSFSFLPGLNSSISTSWCCFLPLNKKATWDSINAVLLQAPRVAAHIVGDHKSMNGEGVQPSSWPSVIMDSFIMCKVVYILQVQAKNVIWKVALKWLLLCGWYLDVHSHCPFPPYSKIFVLHFLHFLLLYHPQKFKLVYDDDDDEK